MQNAKYFSVLDLKNGFFHVEIDEASRKYTANTEHHSCIAILPQFFKVCHLYLLTAS